MYAIIKTGGKQYRVIKGQMLTIEKLDTKNNLLGSEINFGDVLMIKDADSIQVGSPFLSGIKVKAEVLAHGRSDKVEVLKFKRRKHHMKRYVHRQNYTRVKILDISLKQSTI